MFDELKSNALAIKTVLTVTAYQFSPYLLLRHDLFV